MTLLVILLAEGIGLYLVSRALTQRLYDVFFFLSGGRRSAAVSLTTALLFPGTVIHELSHLFTAEILGVRTGKLTLAPENIRDPDIQTGSVAVAQSDPFRRALIGLAPFFLGIGALLAVSYGLSREFSGQTISTLLQGTVSLNFLTILLLYLIFAISTTMFPSGADFKGTPALALTIGIFLLLAYLVGFRFSLSGQALSVAEGVMTTLQNSLGVILAVDLILLLLITVVVAVMRKILHSRLIPSNT
ncbi:hypothetical protein M1555_02070 [Patescibacteria group bacterium]|nr:hypothetical protein [Patescibacteria group bacterium]